MNSLKVVATTSCPVPVALAKACWFLPWQNFSKGKKTYLKICGYMIAGIGLRRIRLFT